MTKYNFDIDNNLVSNNLTRLINQAWKLIPMKENKEDWIRQINTVIIEIIGLNEIFSFNSYFLQLLSKLEGLKLEGNDITFELFRKTVFEILSLIQELKNYVAES